MSALLLIKDDRNIVVFSLLWWSFHQASSKASHVIPKENLPLISSQINMST